MVVMTNFCMQTPADDLYQDDEACWHLVSQKHPTVTKLVC